MNLILCSTRRFGTCLLPCRTAFERYLRGQELLDASPVEGKRTPPPCWTLMPLNVRIAGARRLDSLLAFWKLHNPFWRRGCPPPRRACDLTAPTTATIRRAPGPWSGSLECRNRRVRTALLLAVLSGTWAFPFWARQDRSPPPIPVETPPRAHPVGCCLTFPDSIDRTDRVGCRATRRCTDGALWLAYRWQVADP